MNDCADVPKASRDKGARGEREVAAVFAGHGFDVYRTPNSGGLRVKGDLIGFSHYSIEVKRAEMLRIPAWVRQAEEIALEPCPKCGLSWRVHPGPGTCGAAPPTPILAYRSSREPWRAILPLDVLARLMAVERLGA